MNTGREIVAEIILRGGELQPYIDAGFTEGWLNDRESHSERVFEGQDLRAYRDILEHFGRHGAVMTADLFRRGYPAASYKLPDSDYKPSELIDAAQTDVRRGITSVLVEELVDMHDADDFDGISSKLSETLDKLRTGIEVAAGSTWEPVDIGAWLDGDEEPFTTTLGARDDGVFLLYPGKTHSLVGESEAGKSWLALRWVAQELQAGRYVGYLDFEDSLNGIGTRLVEMADSRAIREHFRYIRPESMLTDGDGLADRLADCSLVVVDGITEAMEMVPYNGNSNDWNGRFAKFQALLLNPIASRGPAVLSIDHPVKSSPSARHASGAGHKLRGLSGASYVLVNKEPFGRGRKGYSSVLVAKDRHGFVRTHGGGTDKTSGMIHIADLIIDNRDAATATEVSLKGPDEFTGFRPTILMDLVSHYLASQDSSVSQNQIETRVTGNAKNIRRATELLVEEGYATKEDLGRGRGVRITHVKGFVHREDEVV